MFQYDSIEDALEALRQGHLRSRVPTTPTGRTQAIPICAAQFATTGRHQFDGHPCQGADLYAHVGRICPKAPAPAKMVADNTDNHETAFTVSIDHVSTTT